MKQEFVQSAAIARSWNSTLLLQGALVVIAYGLLYARLVPGLVNDWYTFSPYSYGFLVPVIAAYLAWQKRGRLKNLPISSSYWGILTLVFALLLFLVAQVITDSFMMRVSMVLAIAALIQTTLGNRFLKELGFPIFYLALMIPVPYVLVNKIVNFLMFFDAKHAATILQLFGIPVYLESNFLHLPNITLEVADVCSGISSLFALFVLGVFYSSLLPLPARLKALVTREHRSAGGDRKPYSNCRNGGVNLLYRSGRASVADPQTSRHFQFPPVICVSDCLGRILTQEVCATASVQPNSLNSPSAGCL